MLAANEQQTRVLEALRHIPVEMQLMIELYYWEEMTGPQLAQVLDIAEATVRTRLHRARAKLKQALEDLAVDPAADVEALTRSLRDAVAS